MSRPLSALTVLFLISAVGCHSDLSYWGADDYAMEAEPEDPQDTGLEDTAADSCDESTPITYWISPDDSNSMSSPVMARDAIMGDWNGIGNVALRTWEFMNYYAFDYGREEDTLAIHVSARPAPDGEEGAWTMNIGVASPALDKSARDPMNLVFSLDTSGSMGGEPIQMLKASMRAIAGELMEGDRVSVVTWNSSQSIELESHVATGPNDPQVVSVIEAISDGGSTDLESGLELAYQLASDNYAPDRINRVILISDGGANVGTTEKELIARHSEREDGEGIYMVGVGVGTATSYNDALMDTVTDEGKGAAVFIGTEGEAAAVFGDRFLEVFDVAAREVAVKLDLPPGFEIERFSGEEYSTDPLEVEPQHLAPNDAMVFQQHLSTCAPELLDENPEVTVTATWRDAVSFEEQSVSRTYRWSELEKTDGSMLWKAEAIFDYALALEAWKSHGGGSTQYLNAYGAWEHAQERAETFNPSDTDLAEVREVMAKLGS